MNTLQKTFLGLSMLLFVAAPLTVLADSCNSSGCDTDCNTSCSTSCNTNNGCGSCSNSDCDNSDCDGSCGGCETCHTILISRPTDSNTAILAYLPQMWEPDCDFKWITGLTYEFQQTFGSCNLGRCIAGTNTLTFQGSQVAGRDNEGALIADNFGLSPFFNQQLTLSPRIRNHNLHFQFFWGFNNWAEGLYLRTDFTFTHQQRNLFENGCTTCTTSSVVTNTTPFPAGYMAQSSISAATSLQEALSGEFLFGDMQTPWNWGRWNFCEMSDNKIAGFSVDLGYNFWLEECSHAGIFLRYTAPTGTKLNGSQKNANAFFSPIIGEHHHKLGGGLTAHKEFWADDCGNSFEIYLHGYAQHLFSDCEVRSFDLLDHGCMSRYQLLKVLTPTTVNDVTTYAFTGSLINAINFTTRNVKSTISVEGDASIWLNYKHNGFTLSLGYNIFGRQEEDLCLRGGVPCNGYDPDLAYGIKGCTGDYYFDYTIATGAITGHNTPFAVASNATSSNSTIYTCSSVDNFAIVSTAGSIGIDYTNVYSGNGAQANAVTNGTLVSDVVQTTVSDPSLVLTDSSLDINSGRAPRLVSNKGFVALNYIWDECDWSPYVTLGGEVEGGSNACDIRQWGAWFRLGFSY